LLLILQPWYQEATRLRAAPAGIPLSMITLISMYFHISYFNQHKGKIFVKIGVRTIVDNT